MYVTSPRVKYDAALEATVTVIDWVSVFDGLSLGLGGFNTNISKCETDREKLWTSLKPPSLPLRTAR